MKRNWDMASQISTLCLARTIGLSAYKHRRADTCSECKHQNIRETTSRSVSVLSHERRTSIIFKRERKTKGSLRPSSQVNGRRIEIFIVCGKYAGTLEVNDARKAHRNAEAVVQTKRNGRQQFTHCLFYQRKNWGEPFGRLHLDLAHGEQTIVRHDGDRDVTSAEIERYCSCS